MPTWGRGGAGNIVSEAQIAEKQRQLAEDLEANRSLTSTEHHFPNPTPAADYAHMGRGGAGNWYQPTELQKAGTFTSSSTFDPTSSGHSSSGPTDSTALPTSSKPQISTPWHPEGQEMPIARAGRGGAGNFVWREKGEGESEEQRREREREVEREMEKEKERVRGEVERGVEEGLKRPGRVVLKVGKGEGVGGLEEEKESEVEGWRVW
ncbi:hypothetical protein GQ43DRAFT_435156 [Delitschia confertaspora ATCC 74209]|uniref:Uncharacterized protein n=1 Tax=Delitschia confertaspora ATCC 74209 TaxID=1513339 RepID=A0A9P4JIQ9_9PLEO|nr:hypothetical protein GQ43DRAFT_435156 [Delitschia confertaspora ATCC 74209]